MEGPPVAAIFFSAVPFAVGGNILLSYRGRLSRDISLRFLRFSPRHASLLALRYCCCFCITVIESRSDSLRPTNRKHPPTLIKKNSEPICQHPSPKGRPARRNCPRKASADKRSVTTKLNK